MTNPWVISKIVHLLTPDRDIDPHGPKHDAPFFDTLIGNLRQLMLFASFARSWKRYAICYMVEKSSSVNDFLKE